MRRGPTRLWAVPVAVAMVGALTMADAALAADQGVTSQTISAPADAADHRFGFAAAVNSDGTIALVGAPGNNPPTGETGKAFVFTRHNGTWTQQAALTPSSSLPHDFFGGAVALNRNGDVAIVGAPGDFLSGAPGRAFIFTQKSGVWTQQAVLTGSGVGFGPGDVFGFSVGLDHSGHTAIVGAPGDSSDKGATYLFGLQSVSWTQEAKLPDPGNPTPINGDNFGFSVAVGLTASGNEALIGADQGGVAGGAAAGPGFAVTYLQRSGVWRPTPTQTLTADDGVVGDAFGNSVDITENASAALIGAEGKDGFKGAAYSFAATGKSFVQKQEITGMDSVSGDLFGYEVRLDDNADIAEISAPFANGFFGNVYRFAGTIGTWSQVLEQMGATNSPDHSDYGTGLALNHDGSVELIGADGEDLSSSNGAVYAYEFS